MQKLFLLLISCFVNSDDRKYLIVNDILKHEAIGTRW